MTQETLTILACAVACGYFKGKADTIAFDQMYIAFGWKKKYHEPLREARYAKSDWYWRLYYALINVEYEEKFFGSTWIFVFLTDKFHLFNWLMWRCIEVMILVLTGFDWSITIWFAIIRGVVFHLFFRRK